MFSFFNPVQGIVPREETNPGTVYTPRWVPDRYRGGAGAEPGYTSGGYGSEPAFSFMGQFGRLSPSVLPDILPRGPQGSQGQEPAFEYSENPSVFRRYYGIGARQEPRSWSWSPSPEMQILSMLFQPRMYGPWGGFGPFGPGLGGFIRGGQFF